MKSGESLKQYIIYFQSQMATVYNCNDDVAVAAFIGGLQGIHSFYRYLVKHEITKMRYILTRAKKYIQIEDVTRANVNRSPKKGRELEGQKIQSALPKKASNRAVNAVNKTSQNPTKHCGGEADTTLFKIHVDRVIMPSRVGISSGTRDHYHPIRRVREPGSIASSMTAEATALWTVLFGGNSKSWWTEDIF